MQVLNRISFLESLVKESQKLNVIFLNHAGAPDTLLIDISSVDLLSDNQSTKSFIAFCISNPYVNYITVQNRYNHKNILVTCKDGTELNFQLIKQKITHSLSCLPFDEIYKEAYVNNFGMFVPSVKHHFEYTLLKSQFSKIAFPDKFQKYFSSLDNNGRTEIFRYIQPKYNLVFNVIEDLYKPKGGVLLKITIGLRKLKANRLSLMAGRFLGQVSFNFIASLSGDKLYHYGEGGNTPASKSKSEGKRIAL